MWTFHPLSHHGIHRRRRHWWLALLVNPRAPCPNDGPLQEAVSVAWSRRGATRGFRFVMGVPPVIIHLQMGFSHGFSLRKTIQLLSIPIDGNPPYLGWSYVGWSCTKLQESIPVAVAMIRIPPRWLLIHSLGDVVHVHISILFVYAILFNVYIYIRIIIIYIYKWLLRIMSNSHIMFPYWFSPNK